MAPPRTDPLARTQQERSAESGQRLLAAAVELIAEKGFDRTTASEIGVRAGYSREMVRHRYGTKEQLLGVLMDEYAARLMRAPAVGGSGLELAVAQLDLILDTAAEHPALLRSFFVLCFESVGPLPSLARWLSDWRYAYRDRLVKVLEAGQQDGSVRVDIDSAAEAHDVVVYGAGLAFAWSTEPDTFDFGGSVSRWRDRAAAHWAAR